MPERNGSDVSDGGASGSTDRFLIDAMCGTLSTYLRMCGYDTAYAPERGVEDDDAILELARSEGRRIVTRDRDLAARSADAIDVASRDVRDQLRVMKDADIPLELPEEPERCSACNGTLELVGADASTPEYAPDADETRVWKCVDCGQHFWCGSHWDDVRTTLADL